MDPLIASSGHVPFYVAAGALALWAIIVGLIGIRNGSFPSGEGASKLVGTVTVVLVVGTVGMAIYTAETPEEIEPSRPEISLGVVPQPGAPAAADAGGPAPEGGGTAAP